MAPACSPSEGTDRAEEDSVYAAIRQQISEGGKHGPRGRFDKRITREWLSCFGCASRAWESYAGGAYACRSVHARDTHCPLLVPAGTMERGVLGAAAIAAQARRPSPLRSHARTHARTHAHAHDPLPKPIRLWGTLSQRSCHAHYRSQFVAFNARALRATLFSDASLAAPRLTARRWSSRTGRGDRGYSMVL